MARPLWGRAMLVFVSPFAILYPSKTERDMPYGLAGRIDLALCMAERIFTILFAIALIPLKWTVEALDYLDEMVGETAYGRLIKRLG